MKRCRSGQSKTPRCPPATTRLKARYPDLAIIGLSVNAGEENQKAMKKAGATSLITKEAAVEQLYAAIQETSCRGTNPP